jgi:hypothetical protein
VPQSFYEWLKRVEADTVVRHCVAGIEAQRVLEAKTRG